MADQPIQSLQYPTYFQPNTNNGNIYDAQGNLVTLEQYKAATGQTNIPDDQLDLQYVQAKPLPPDTGSVNPLSNPEIAAVWNQLAPADKAFVTSALGVVKNQYEAGGPVNINKDTWTNALLNIATDPTIKSQYGDVAAMALPALTQSITQLTQDQATAQAVQQATMLQNKQDLDAKLSQGFLATSGFRQEAEKQLAANNADVIQSTRSTIQQKLQSLGQDYESKFGSAGLPPINVNGQLTGNQSYTPTGNIIGSNVQGQTTAEMNEAQAQGLLPSVSSAGVVSSNPSAK